MKEKLLQEWEKARNADWQTQEKFVSGIISAYATLHAAVDLLGRDKYVRTQNFKHIDKNVGEFCAEALLEAELQAPYSGKNK